jgi:hypothetical protein
VRRKNRVIAELRTQLELAKGDPFDPSRLIWIFGSGRTGSTWLGRLLGELRDSAHWSEPLIGALFGEFYFERFPQRRGRQFLMADAYRDAWLGDIRSMMLRQTSVRYGDLSGYVAINEPHGTMGAPLLSAALPESRFVLLVRDPRDVIASVHDAHREGGWAAARRDMPANTADKRPDFISVHSQRYMWDLGSACQAFRLHSGPKAIVRYEDLRADTPGELRRLCDELGLKADDRALATVSDTQSWDSVPEGQKGEGRRYRKASPGSWKDDLSAEQLETVERICAPVLEGFYDGEIVLLEDPFESRPVNRARTLWARIEFNRMLRVGVG